MPGQKFVPKYYLIHVRVVSLEHSPHEWTYRFRSDWRQEGTVYSTTKMLPCYANMRVLHRPIHDN